MERPIAYTVLTRIASTVLNFLMALFIARHAGPAVKGEVTLLITTIWFFIFFSNILGGQALVYLIPRRKPEMLLVPAYIWTLVVTGAGYLFLQFMVPVVAVAQIPSVVALCFLSSLFSIHHSMLLSHQQIAGANVLQVIPLVLQLGGVLACFYVFDIHTADAYIYASLAAYLVAAPAGFLMLRRHIRPAEIFRDFSWKETASSFRYGLFYQLVEVLQLLHLRYYFYQLGLQQGSQYLGVFSIGISILETVWIIPRSISTVHYISTSNSVEIDREVNRTVRLLQASFVLCAVAVLLIAAIPSAAYTWVFGPGFSDVKHSMRFLYPGILIYSVPIVLSSFYLGIGRYSELLLSNVAGLITLIVFSYLLIPPYVMSGAGLAATLSFSVSGLLLFMYFMMDNRVPVSRLFSLDGWKGKK